MNRQPYQHYKGGIYKLLSTSVWHTETNERLAVYENAEGKVFARPYDMFFEKVDVNGEMVDRFRRIKTEDHGVIRTHNIQKTWKQLQEDGNYMNNLLKRYGRDNP